MTSTGGEETQLGLLWKRLVHEDVGLAEQFGRVPRLTSWYLRLRTRVVSLAVEALEAYGDGADFHVLP